MVNSMFIDFLLSRQIRSSDTKNINKDVMIRNRLRRLEHPPVFHLIAPPNLG